LAISRAPRHDGFGGLGFAKERKFLGNALGSFVGFQERKRFFELEFGAFEDGDLMGLFDACRIGRALTATKSQIDGAFPFGYCVASGAAV
jgi:hypothetical protein